MYVSERYTQLPLRIKGKKKEESIGEDRARSRKGGKTKESKRKIT
jgi:hypothetical protein